MSSSPHCTDTLHHRATVTLCHWVRPKKGEEEEEKEEKEEEKEKGVGDGHPQQTHQRYHHHHHHHNHHHHHHHQTVQGHRATETSNCWVTLKFVCLFVGCLTSQQHASVSQGRICSDNCTCCHTEIEVADQTFYLAQSQDTDTRPTSPSADPVTPGAWQGSHWSANF